MFEVDITVTAGQEESCPSHISAPTGEGHHFVAYQGQKDASQLRSIDSV